MCRATGLGITRFIIICQMLFLSPVFAEADFSPNFNPSLDVRPAAGEIKIDGRLDDAGWAGAALADNFCECNPGDQVRPPVETRVYLTYSSNHLYVAFVCFDDPADIRASHCERDRMYNDDNVGFFFDTYGDAAWAYYLNVNPHGVQADALWSNGYGEDNRYDLIWESAGQITDSGYQVEMAIPFASLRFPDTPQQTWKVEFYRHHYRASHHYISWVAFDRDEPCWSCQWGTVTGIENVSPGKGVEILPAVVGFQSGRMDGDGTPETPYDFVNDDADGDVSLGLKYGITSNITAEATFNPDFSQVEADADQIDVNTTFALSFPEKRPFFQEGRDLFRTIFNAVYTRSINDPAAAAKFTARISRTSIAYMGAYDENSPLIMPFEEQSMFVQLGKTTSNIMRIRQTFGESSQIGFLATDRRYEGCGSGSALSLDGSLRMHKNLRLRWQAITTHTEEPDAPDMTSGITVTDYINDTAVSINDYVFDADGHTAGFDGESFWGHGYIGLLDYEARDVEIGIRWSETSPTFRLDNGFEPSNNRRQAGFDAEYQIRFENSLVEYLNPSVVIARVWNADGKIKDEWINLSLSANLTKAMLSFHASYFYSAENFHDVQFDDIWGWHICGHATPNRLVSLGGNINYAHRIARRAVVMGRETSSGVWLDVKPISRLLIENWFNYMQSYDMDSDAELFKGFIARTRLNLQCTQALSVRFVAQYNDFRETWDFDPLVTYRLSPFSLFYIGTTYDYEKLYGLTDDNRLQAGDGEPSYDRTRLQTRQFFMKLQYLFQI